MGNGQWAMGNGQWKDLLVAVAGQRHHFLIPISYLRSLLPIALCLCLLPQIYPVMKPRSRLKMRAMVFAGRSFHSMVTSTEDCSGFGVADHVVKSSDQGC